MPTGYPKVLAETPDWWVVDKPAGWLSVPGSDGDTSGTITGWLRERGHPFPVHRLDVQTSGVLLVARSSEAHARANGWFQRHEVKKLYHFLAGGPAPAQPTLKVSEAVEGKPATTLLEIRERWGERAFLGWARPLTGRRHQIRRHLASLKRPLLGDVQYGGSGEFPRVALHAARLELPSGEIFESAWPEDFSAWVKELRG
jgi:23S rRNA-/tRNA-specific pseudouridylate synthase